MAFIYFFNTDLSDEVIKSISENPYQMFEWPSLARIYTEPEAPPTPDPKFHELTTLKPPVGSQINWSNPLARGIIGFWMFNEFAGKGELYDHSDYKHNVPRYGGSSANLTWVPEGLDFFEQNFRLTGTNVLKPNYITIEVVFTPDVGDDWHGVVTRRMYETSDPWNSYSIGRNDSTGKISFNISNSISGGSQTTLDGEDWEVGVRKHIISTFDGNDMRIYTDGVETNQTSKTGTIAYESSDHGFFIANTRISGTSAGEDFDGTIEFIRIWNRVLTADEIKEITFNPYQMFEWPSMPRPFPYEDFVEHYTEVDPASDITVNDSEQIYFSSVQKQTDCYVYSDQGVDFFDGDFTHEFEARINTGWETLATIHFWSLSNNLGSAQDHVDNSWDFLSIEGFPDSGGSRDYRIYVVEINNGSWQNGTYFELWDDTWYYFRVIRDESVGSYGQLRVEVYTDAARTNLFESQNLALTEKQDFRYQQVVTGHGSTGTEQCSGYVQKLFYSSAAPGEEPGDVLITPDALFAIASRANPTAILGSILSTPSVLYAIAQTLDPTVLANVLVSPIALSAIAATVNPTAILGSLLVSPAVRTAIAATLDPSILYGATLASPDAISAIAQIINPTTLYGSTFTTPAALSAIAQTLDPSAILGSILNQPSALSAVAKSINPNTLYGSTVAYPAVLSAIAAALDPTVLAGGILVSPAALSAIARAIAPTLFWGSSIATPAALNAIAQTIVPSILYGSTSTSPAALSTIAATLDPTALYGSTITSPAALNAIATTLAPSTLYGSTSTSPAALSAIATTLDPATLYGSTLATPSALSAIAAILDPSTLYGSTLATSVLSAIAKTVNPDILFGGGLFISPAAIYALAKVFSPEVIMGSMLFSPDSLSTIAQTLDPSVIEGWGSLILTPDTINAIAKIISPLTILGSVTSVPTANSVIAQTLDPTSILGNVLKQPEYSSAITRTSDPAFLYGSTIASPGTSWAIAKVIDPEILAGGLFISMSAVTAIANTLNPNPILGSIYYTPDGTYAIANSNGPSIILGSLSVSSLYSSAITETISPYTLLGSINIENEFASAATNVELGNLELSSVIITPNFSQAYARAVDPGIFVDALFFTPDPISAVAKSFPGATLYGSLEVSRTVAKAIANALDPSVSYEGSALVIPTAINARTITGDPVFVYGSIIVLPDGSLVLAKTADPDVWEGTLPDPEVLICPGDALSLVTDGMLKLCTGQTRTVPTVIRVEGIQGELSNEDLVKGLLDEDAELIAKVSDSSEITGKKKPKTTIKVIVSDKDSIKGKVDD
jgi:hypothetical protein